MSARRPVSERLYAGLTLLYPAPFRAEYGGEMARAFGEWRRSEARGGVRFWGAVARDLARSVPAEWRAELRGRRSAGDPHPPPYRAAALAGLAVLTLYVLTLAPTVAFWDAGEYITVAHLLAIPHPPGSPLFVLLAKGWELLLAPLGLPVAVRINLLSAALSAGSHALWFLVVDRSLAGWAPDRFARRLAAGAAVVVSATAFTVWNQSDVAEKVYSVSFLTVALVSWILLRWRDRGRGPELLAAAAFVVALSSTNHPMGVLVAPAALLFVLLVERRVLARGRFWALALPLCAVALSVQLFLPLRAAQRPIIAEGDPRCESLAGAAASVYSQGRAGCAALSAVLTRDQYQKPSIALDPNDPSRPRGGELVRAQLANYLQYFNWQWARSLGGYDPLVGGARAAVTLAFLLLGVAGFRAHRRGDPAGAAYLGALFVTLSLGLVAYLNFRYGYSIARERVPDPSMHEVRERDYFFLIGFSVWGLWAGMGVVALWRRVSEALAERGPRPRLAAAPVLALALLPLALNWQWATRAGDHAARDWAYNLLMSVEPYGVLLTNGDNDTFPLWYLQEVEGVRKDVTVIVSSYLNTPWYVRQIRDLTRPCPPGVDPGAEPSRIVCQRPFQPGEIPAPLVAAGWTEGVEPPRDSILPITDAEIDRIAGEYVVTPEPLLLRAGGLEARVEAGTRLLPAELFVATLLRETMGERPIHLMPGSPSAIALGLYEHTVRQGLVWKLREGGEVEGGGSAVVPLPEGFFAPMGGAAIDLALTDTLLWDVYLRRGRLLDDDAPWVDAATGNVIDQYALSHYAAAQGHALREDEPAVARHMERARWWERVLGG